MNRPFRNRAHAGQALAERLADLANRPNTIVLGLPRGGVPVAAEVARAINAPLDCFIVRKLGVPRQPELAMGAIASGDAQVLNQRLIADIGISPEQIEQVAVREREELLRREQAYRGSRLPHDLREKTVVLVDDGLATGATMRVAVQAVRTLGAAEVIVGVPVGSEQAVALLGREADRVECVSTPPNFQALGQWYLDFLPTTDEEVLAALGG